MGVKSKLCSIELKNKVFPERYTLLCTSHIKQEAQLMLTTGSTRLAVSRGQQTWYFGSYVTFILAVCCSSNATGLYILRR